MTSVLIAVSDGAQVRSYHRSGDGALTQVAQFLVAEPVEPAELATIVADLSDRFGWAEGQQPQARPAPRLPASSPPAKRAASAPAKASRHRDYRPTPEQRRAEGEAIAAYIRAHPGCTKRDIAAHVWPDERDTTGRLAMRIRTHIEQSGLPVRYETGTALGHPDLLYLNGDS